MQAIKIANPTTTVALVTLQITFPRVGLKQASTKLMVYLTLSHFFLCNYLNLTLWGSLDVACL